MSQSLLNIVADFTVQLSSAVAIGDTTATLSSATDDDSVVLPTGLYGFTIDSGQSNKEYVICTLTGTALTSVQSISRQGVATTGFARAHRRGAKVSITDWAIFSRMLKNLNGTTGFNSTVNLGYDAAPTGLTANQFATVNYVLSVVNGGSVTFDMQIVPNQTSGETVAVNDVVYLSEADGFWYKADANDITASEQVQLGITKTASVGPGPIQVAISGVISGFSGLSVGVKYYLSNTAGAISTTEGANAVFVGWSLSTTSLLLNTSIKTLPVGVLSTTVNPENIINEDNLSAATTDQTQSTQNVTVEVGEADATTKKNKIAQSFIPARTKVRGVNLYKSADSGSFTGTVTVSIQADSSGSPSGSALVTKTITNAEWLLNLTGEIDVEFASEYSLSPGATYWLVIETSTSDNTNHPNLGTNSAGGYSNGSVKYRNTTDGWTALATVDLYFKTLEGVANQVIKTNSSGKIESKFYSLSQMPLQAFQQITTSATGAVQGLGSTEPAFGSNEDGSVFYVRIQGSGTLSRFQRDSITGQYAITHEITPTLTIPASDAGSIIVIGLYMYMFANDGTNIVCSRFLAADLTGEQVMTVPTVACTQWTNSWTDGTFAYVVSSTTSTTSRRWSVSGTTFTAVSTAACESTTAGSTMSDGVNVYSSIYQEAAYSGELIRKFSDIHRTTTVLTTKYVPVMSDTYLGTILINIDTQRMYLGKIYNIYDETAAIVTAIQLTPITKP